MQTTITFRFDEGQSPDFEAVRLTVGTVLMRHIGAHARLKRLTADQWRLDTGRKPESEVTQDAAAEAEEVQAKGEEEVTPEESELWKAYDRWCELMVATTGVQVVRKGKKAKDLDPETPTDWPWEDTNMAALGWDKPAAILDLPVDLVGSWQTQIRATNPGIFGPPLTGQAPNAKKKTHGVLAIA